MIYHVNIGRYILGHGQSAQDVALKVYGEPKMYTALLKANTGSRWETGDVINVPNKKGRESVVEPGETTSEFISRLYPGHMVHQFIDKYLLWNDGHIVEDLVGTTVFVPER